MSDVDSKPTAAEDRIAAYGRDALARAEASGRLKRLVESTTSSTGPAGSTQASQYALGTSWPLAVGAAALAGVVAIAWFATRDVRSETPGRSPATGTTAPAPLDVPQGIAPVATTTAATSPGVAVASLPDAAPAKRVASTTARELTPARTQDEPAAGQNAAPGAGDGASALFERANIARRGGDHASAETLYTELVTSHPASREGMTSRVILGRLLLARGAASEALASFDVYLGGAPRGTLAEQALIGRAQCLQALGRRDEERIAWRALLEAFPATANRQIALERSADSR